MVHVVYRRTSVSYCCLLMYKASRTSSAANIKTFEGENSRNLASGFTHNVVYGLSFIIYSMHAKVQIGGLQGAVPLSLKQLGSGSYS